MIARNAGRGAVGVLGVVALLVVAIVVANSGGSRYTLRAAFSAAFDVTPGNWVKIAGVTVGSVDSVKLVHGQAVVGMEIDDRAVRPLRRGTRAAIRFGTTVSTAERYVELMPGPAGARALPSGSLLTRRDTVTPVEFDQLFNVLDARSQKSLQGVITHAGQGLRGQAGALGNGLVAAPGGLDAAANLMEALGADNAALRELVGSGASTTAALDREDPQLKALLQGAAQTFNTLAENASPLSTTLVQAPATLAAARVTLSRTNTSLGTLDRLVDDLRPGAAGLRSLAPSAAAAVSRLQRVAPLASSTLVTATRAAPTIQSFLRRATPFIKLTGTTLQQAAPELACVRPYAPEIAGFLSTWAGFTEYYDQLGHYARSLVQVDPVINGTPLNAAQTLKLLPGLTYAFPRVPGLNAGQPWFQPNCQAGPSTLDATLDPETIR